MSALNRIRKKLQKNPDAKFGFVVYRCTPHTDVDDAKWVRFMDYLNAQARAKLEEAGAGDLIERLDWNVQDDGELVGKGEGFVRSRFREFLKENKEPVVVSSRFRACVFVDGESVESVIQELDELEAKGKGMDEFDMYGVAWVTLVSVSYEGSVGDDGDGEGDDGDEEGDDEGEEDERKEEVEKDEVSSTMVGISYLVPRVFILLDGPGWGSFVDGSGRVAVP